MRAIRLQDWAPVLSAFSSTPHLYSFGLFPFFFFIHCIFYHVRDYMWPEPSCLLNMFLSHSSWLEEPSFPNQRSDLKLWFPQSHKTLLSRLIFWLPAMGPVRSLPVSYPSHSATFILTPPVQGSSSAGSHTKMSAIVKNKSRNAK